MGNTRALETVRMAVQSHNSNNARSVPETINSRGQRILFSTQGSSNQAHGSEAHMGW